MLAKNLQRVLPDCWRHLRSYSLEEAEAHGFLWGPSLVGLLETSRGGLAWMTVLTWTSILNSRPAPGSDLLAKSRLPCLIICELTAPAGDLVWVTIGLGGGV